MKCVGLFALLAALGADAGYLRRQAQTPMDRVAALLEEMKARIMQDGKLEQQSYDKYACWCEDTMGRKANDIANGKEQIEQLQSSIVKGKSEIASHGAEIKQTKQDIAANIEAQRDATAVRDKENGEYAAEKTESEQCIGALEQAIKVLTGAGDKNKKAFLETLQEAQLLSVVAGVRDVVSRPRAAAAVSSKDMSMVKHFLERPEDFVSGRSSGFMSAAQIANNPFGDYAPQSTQIQGILKGMYDTFVGDMEKNNADEADAQKAFEELMKTKNDELETLQGTLQQHELDEATKSKKLADDQELLDDTKVQLDADETFFADVKEGCQLKAEEWSERTQLRTQELAGVGQAIDILTNPAARQTFTAATTTFVQVSAHRSRNVGMERNSGMERTVRAAQLANLARKFHSLNLAQISADLKNGGHFDKVMVSISSMMEVLRKEEQDDISHRDRCQNAEGKSTNDMEDLNHDIDKAGKKISLLNDQAGKLRGEIKVVKGEIKDTRDDMAKALTLRNQDVSDFRQAVKEDTDAIAILEQAIVALTRFFQKNKIDLALIKKGEPEYSVDQDKAPETSWSGPKYGGRKSETEGIVAIVQMIKEDLEKEIRTARKDDAAAQKQYEAERGALQDTLDASIALKLAREKGLNEVEGKTADTEELKNSKNNDLNAESDLKNSIYSDCSWVTSHFESRRQKRKAEMDGLNEAKSFLSGVEAGDDPDFSG